jgi:hypothetical protein
MHALRCRRRDMWEKATLLVRLRTRVIGDKVCTYSLGASCL